MTREKLQHFQKCHAHISHSHFLLVMAQLVRATHGRALDLATPIEVPTLVIWGEEDVALDLICLEGTERYVRDLTIRRLPGVSHWVQQDAPDAVNALLKEALLF